MNTDTNSEEVFAIYLGQTVLVLDVKEDEVLIAFDDGSEKYVSIQSLEFV